MSFLPLSMKWMLLSTKTSPYLKVDNTHQRPALSSVHTLCELSVYMHIYTPPGSGSFEQTPQADWYRVSINSRWYHWEKMEHNVENTPCLVPTGCDNKERLADPGYIVHQRQVYDHSLHNIP